MDDMDLEEKFGSLTAAFRALRAPALLVSFDTDWLFPPAETRRIDAAMRAAEIAVTQLEIATPNGHDAFLVDYPLITPPVRDFLAAR